MAKLYTTLFTIAVIYFAGCNEYHALVSDPCKNKTADSIRKLIKTLSVLRTSDTDSALVVSARALKMTERIGCMKLKSAMFRMRCVIYKWRGEYNSALASGLSALKLSEDMKDDTGIAKAYDVLGDVYRFVKEYPKAVEYERKTLEYQERGIYKRLEYHTNAALSICYGKIDSLKKASAYGYEAKRLWEETSDSASLDLHSMIYRNMATIALKENDEELARTYFKESRYNIPDSNDHVAKSLLYADVADFFKLKSEKCSRNPQLAHSYLDSAAGYSKLALAEAIPLKNKDWEMDASEFLAKYYYKKDSVKAITYYKMACDARAAIYTPQNINRFIELRSGEEKRQLIKEDERIEDERRKYRIKTEVKIALVLFLSYILVILIAPFNRSNMKIITWLGTTVVLSAYEYVNILIHPLIDYTNGFSMWFSLLVLTLIGALLLNLHHMAAKSIAKMIERMRKSLIKVFTFLLELMKSTIDRIK